MSDADIENVRQNPDKYRQERYSEGQYFAYGAGYVMCKEDLDGPFPNSLEFARFARDNAIEDDGNLPSIQTLYTRYMAHR